MEAYHRRPSGLEAAYHRHPSGPVADVEEVERTPASFAQPFVSIADAFSVLQRSALLPAEESAEALVLAETLVAAEA